MLKAIYGGCQQNYSFCWSASPRDYAKTPIGMTLDRIQSSLENFRGHGDFIKSPLVPPCDYYVSAPPFILEFDENQHFSGPRLIALSLYPDDLKLGFSVADWRDLCRGEMMSPSTVTNGAPGMIRSAIWFLPCTVSLPPPGFMAALTHGARWMPAPLATGSGFLDGFRADYSEVPEIPTFALPKTFSPPLVSIIERFVFSLILEPAGSMIKLGKHIVRPYNPIH